MPTRSFKRRRLNKSGVISVATAACLIPVSAAIAQTSTQRLGPDLLQTLGVGSRSIAMGDAYTAIADDASASFWNVGRLGFIRHDEAMVEYRSVATSSFSSDNSRSNPLSVGMAPSKPQLGFIGIVLPVTSRPNWLGSLGISYTMGGYFSATKDVTNSVSGTGSPLLITTSNSASQILVRNSYLTFAYGHQFLWTKSEKAAATKDSKKAGDANKSANSAAPAPAVSAPAAPSRLGVGLGVFFVNQQYGTQTQSTVSQSAGGGGPITSISDTGLIPVSEVGTGVGVTLGLAYDPASSPYSFGLSYHSKTQLNGLVTGLSFGNQTPDHLAIGMAYKPVFKRKATLTATDADADAQKPKDIGVETSVPLTISLEGEVFSAVNLSRDSLGQLNMLDQRKAVSNLHLGTEYRQHYRRYGKTAEDRAENPQYEYALRMGFHTNANAATLYTYYDNVVSFGVAVQRLHKQKLTYSLEPSVEILTHSGLVQYTMTGRVTW